jgi:ABC-type polysaccharide/polyol phosphate transport system ATPase subunit
MQPCIQLVGVSKHFWITKHRAQTVSGFLIDLARFWRRPERVQFTALCDLSLAVYPGQTVGVIGPNGSGKSTLLRLIAGIYRPSTGTIMTRGTIAALMELGAGFHAELSGRENIYLNGALLGRRRAEMGRQLDEIIAFAGIEEFLDTPLKHYSSGMQMRLGFSIAMAVGAEIMLLDEVFAVGDVAFQAKCRARLNELQAEGRTLIIVSHGMEWIDLLCNRVIWLDRGVLRADGPPADVIAAYTQHMEALQA